MLPVAGGAVLAFALDLRDATGLLLLPLTASQILWINLVTDGLPAIKLAFDRTTGAMRRVPRAPDVPLLVAPSVRFVAGAGTMKALLALGILGLFRGWGTMSPRLERPRSSSWRLASCC